MLAYRISRKKVRSKALGQYKGKKRTAAAAPTAAVGGGGPSNEDNSSGGNKKMKASSSDSYYPADKQLQEAQERAPAPPECSLSDTELSEIEIKINRSPVMVLWAAVRYAKFRRV